MQIIVELEDDIDRGDAYCIADEMRNLHFPEAIKWTSVEVRQ